MQFVWVVVIAACMSPACRQQQLEPPVQSPAYNAGGILPSGSTEMSPLAPGMLVTIYGEHLGPEAACSGSADPDRRETPNPLRPNQTLIETQVFPTRLCETEVEVGGVAAGLLYVQAQQINFKVPQELGVEGIAAVQVSYQGQAGPALRLVLGNAPNTESAEELADRIWSGLQRVEWEIPYRPTDRGSDVSCGAVPEHPSLLGGVYGYAYHCSQTVTEVIGESFYYPVNPEHPDVLLLRADFRLATPYPAMSAQVEQLLRDRLSQAYGTGSVPTGGDRWPVGAHRPEPGLSWQAGEVTIFVHRNRHYVKPVGVRVGVQLVAIRSGVLEEGELITALRNARSASNSLAQPTLASDLRNELGELYVMPMEYPKSESERLEAERKTSASLLRLLRDNGEGEPAHRAAVLVAADDLVVRLGSLLVRRSIGSGAEILAEAPAAEALREQLATYGVKYTGIGHYSGDLEYDRSLLSRAWAEFPETRWGQRAFLMLQGQSCSLPQFGCEGLDCFRAVIEQGERFLRDYPDTPFRHQQTYLLAIAYETWWGLSQAPEDDPTAEGALAGSEESAECARRRAIGLYEELLRIAPESPEARLGQFRLPRLKLGLGSGERMFFCFTC